MTILLQGNCLELLPTLSPESVKLVLTDPLYLVNYKTRDGRTVPKDDNDVWIKPAFAEAFRDLARDSYAVSVYGYPDADRFIEDWRAAGFRIVGHLLFPKSYSSNSFHMGYRHECAYMHAKGKPRPNQVISDVLSWK